MTAHRGILLPLLLVPIAALAACAPGGPAASPTEAPDVVTVDLAAAALPAADELPDGFEQSYRCPGSTSCSAPADADVVSVSGRSTDPAGEDGPWGGGSFWLNITVYDDVAGAADGLDQAREDAEIRDGDPYTIEVDEISDTSFIPGEDGTGSVAEVEIDDWTGIESLVEFTYSGPISDGPSSLFQGSRVTLIRDDVELSCTSFRLATAGEDAAADDCREATQRVVDRLADLNAAEVPRIATPRRVAAALPADDALPKGAEVTVRCPDDDSICSGDDQTQDASVSAYIPLPDGVTAAGDTGRDRFRVAGGEWTDDLWLRVWIRESADAASGEVAEAHTGYSKDAGSVDTAPEKTDTGYLYGIHGTSTVTDIDGDGWSGFVQLYDATFEHLDGRITERHFDVTALASSGPVFVRVTASLTNQGRDAQDAIDLVSEQIEAYFARLNAS